MTSESRLTPSRIVVMGVSGCGKSRIGRALAERLRLPFFDADDYHSPDNVEKMARGMPLTDDDRADWLATLAQVIRDQPGLVLACSALRQSHRDSLRAGDPDLAFIHLCGDYETIRDRLAARSGHFFRGDVLLRSQFATLEPPSATEAAQVDAAQDPETVVAACLDRLARFQTRRT